MSLSTDPNIDDPEYLYRYQARRDLLHMQAEVGANLSACVWSGKYRHQEYVRREPLVAKGHRIYSLSVWRNESLARSHFRGSSFPGQSFVLMRIPRRAVRETPLQWCDDDWLSGQALLLFEEAPWTQEQVYGPSSIPWSCIDMTELTWSPLEIMEEDRLVAVRHPYARTYRHLPDDRNDYGLPQAEIQVRNLLRALTETESALHGLSPFQLIRRKEPEAVRLSLFEQCHAIDRNAPSIRATRERLERSLPQDHPWHSFLNLFS